MATSSEEMQSNLSESGRQLQQALLKFYGEMRELIKCSFFSIETLGFAGGTQIEIDGKTHLTPDSIAFMLERLAHLKTSAAYDLLIKRILTNIENKIEGKDNSVLWKRAEMVALCYRLLADTFSLSKKMDNNEKKNNFLTQRFNNLVPTLIFVKNMLHPSRAISNDKAAALLGLVQRNQSVTELDLSACDLNIEEVMAIIYMMPGSAITALDLSNNHLLSNSLMPLLESLVRLPELQSLSLAGIAITEAESLKLAEVLADERCQIKVSFTPAVTVTEATVQAQSTIAASSSQILPEAISPFVARSPEPSSTRGRSIRHRCPEKLNDVAGANFGSAFFSLFSSMVKRPTHSDIEIPLKNLVGSHRDSGLR